MTEQRVARIGTAAFAIVLLGLGVLATFWPAVLAVRFRPVSGVDLQLSFGAATAVVRSVALPLILAGMFGLWAAYRSDRLFGAVEWCAAIAAVIAYVSLERVLADWTVDDAAITFAYSENLVRGYGLVLHPSHPPEEAYSNTLWMLILALARSLGLAIDVAAKVLGAACAAACVLITMRMCAWLQAPHPGYGAMLACAIVALGAPFVIWSSSGLEHGLQALLFVMIAAAPLLFHRSIGTTGACLGALMLLRPETPLIVLATVCVYARQRFSGERYALLRLWPLITIPLMVGVGLLAFRLYYFGAPFPNPYYAKASAATFARVFNFVGGGWGYVFDWLSNSGALLLVPLLLLGVSLRIGLTVRLACALILAQLLFVLYAGGDWMSGFRFIAPILPLLAILLAAALHELGPRFSSPRVEVVALILAWFLGIGSIVGLQRFRAAPTTPTSVVTAIGREFVELAQRLGIEHPTLAHHDAGGTSWAAGIDVLDLGGLGNKAIAQHMRDPQFMREYLFVERRPTFVFGSATTFAAGLTGFYRMPEFTEQYVPVRFPGRAHMQADLSHIRRDLVREIAGILRVEEDGRLVAVILGEEGVQER